MKYSLVLLMLIAGPARSVSFPAAAIPMTGQGPSPRTAVLQTRDRQADAVVALVPGRLEAGLERLTPAERQNAEVALDLGPGATPAAQVAARAIERDWNAGDHAAALAGLRELTEQSDPTRAFVSVNWRRPLPGPARVDWDADVQIGTRDSVVHAVFERHNATGNLFVFLVCNAGTETYAYTNLSTDNGLTWVETGMGYWAVAHAVLDVSATANGSHFYACYASLALPNYIRCARYLALDGIRVPFRDDSLVVTVLTTDSADTIVQVAATSADDEWPGERIYCFGSTSLGNLVFACADSFAQPWSPVATSVSGWCDGALSCAFSPFFTTRGLFASWRYLVSDTESHVGLGWVDTSDVFQSAYFNPGSPAISVTSLAAAGDTAVVAYGHGNASGSVFYTRELFSTDNGANWTWSWIPNDTLGLRENVSITARHGGGVAAAYRERVGGSGRNIMFTRAGYHPVNWSVPDTVSDFRPATEEVPRVQWLGPDRYGVVYVKWYDAPGYTAWFDWSDFGAIAEQPALTRTGPGLNVLPCPGGVRLSFDNPAAGRVRLRIFDVSGRQARSETRLLTPGRQVIDCLGLGSGLYFAWLDFGGRMVTGKFVVAR
jgi:hypothetical protein